MTYLQDKKRRETAFFKKVFFVGIIILVIFGITKIQKFFAPLLSSTISNVSVVGKATYQNRFWSYFSSKSILANENNSLRQQISELQTKNTELGLIESENRELRVALQNSPEEAHTILVKSLGNSSVYGTVVIDSGINKNIKVGDFLLGSKGALIGKVTEVYNATSQVLLYDTSASSTTLLTLDSETVFDAQGDSRGVLSANVPRDIQVEVGEVVVLKSNPKILLGTVAASKGDERDPFKQVLVRMEDQYNYSPYLYILHQ